jgi:hypothetical protein
LLLRTFSPARFGVKKIQVTFCYFGDRGIGFDAVAFGGPVLLREKGAFFDFDNSTSAIQRGSKTQGLDTHARANAFQVIQRKKCAGKWKVKGS